jgi:hypothetical protein
MPVRITSATMGRINDEALGLIEEAAEVVPTTAMSVARNPRKTTPSNRYVALAVRTWLSFLLAMIT